MERSIASRGKASSFFPRDGGNLLSRQTCLCFRENITAGFKATNEFAPDAIIALLYFLYCCTRSYKFKKRRI